MKTKILVPVGVVGLVAVVLLVSQFGGNSATAFEGLDEEEQALTASTDSFDSYADSELSILDVDAALDDVVGPLSVSEAAKSEAVSSASIDAEAKQSDVNEFDSFLSGESDSGEIDSALNEF
jgi:hypothetical protein